jgi:hypothetical protein
MAKITINTKPGTPVAGGFFARALRIDNRPHAVIVANKEEGEFAAQSWNGDLKRVAGALSFYDGLANTRAMARAGSEIAKRVLKLRIGGVDGWCIGARDQTEVLYRVFKPDVYKCNQWRSGDNPSSIPPGYPYAEKDMVQTAVKAFRKGGAEALEEEAYWTSTQLGPNPGSAWCQNLRSGYQNYSHKSVELRVRVLRMIPI